MPRCLAIDIGASGGRHILGDLKDGKIECKEVYRFANHVKKENGSLVWDMEYLTDEVIKGIGECGKLGVIPDTLAIDTWAVDYVLLDRQEREILPVYAYRDARTSEISEEVSEIVSQDELYARTGIQKLNFNTIYQLYCDKKAGRLENAQRFLMIPDYLTYRLTGKMMQEYTNATTTNLLNAETRDWDEELLRKLGISAELFQKPSSPGTFVGNLSEEIRARVGFDCKVVLCASHDTASAVAGCPMEEGAAFLSSGTWSLFGREMLKPILSKKAMDANFSNEGGIEYRVRFLKNIIGMWLFQEIRRELQGQLTYQQTTELARSSTFTEKIDPNAPEFLAPVSMLGAIRKYLGKPALPLGDVLNSVYLSLAETYAHAVQELEEITGKKVEAIYIVGGGSQDRYLNRLTCEATHRRVYAGPAEATAMGNLAVQMMYLEHMTIQEVRNIIRNSVDLSEEKGNGEQI